MPPAAVALDVDAFLGETDHQGRTPSFGKVAVAGIVGNEEGAHNVAAGLFQVLNDTGWTAAMLASNAAHLAKLLKRAAYPGVKQEG